MDSAVCRRCPRSGGDIIAGPLRSGVELCIRRGRHSCDDGDGGRASLYCVCARGHGGLHRDFRSSVELRGSLRRERSVRGGSSEFSQKFILHVWGFLFRVRLNGKVVAVCHPPMRESRERREDAARPASSFAGQSEATVVATVPWLLWLVSDDALLWTLWQTLSQSHSPSPLHAQRSTF